PHDGALLETGDRLGEVRLDDDTSRGEGPRTDHQHAGDQRDQPADDEQADQEVVGLGLHREAGGAGSSSAWRSKNRRTSGWVEDLASSRGSPSATMPLVAPSSSTHRSTMLRMLGSSCVTRTKVMDSTSLSRAI